MTAGDDDILDLTKHFVCLHCSMIVNDPNELECCGSLLCRECIPAFKLQNSICLNCNIHIRQIKPNSFAKRMLSQVTLNCIFNCGIAKSHLEIRAHTLNCDKRIYACTDCNFKGLKSDFKLHFMDKHEASFFKAYELYKESKVQLIVEDKPINRCAGVNAETSISNRLKMLQSYSNEMNYSLGDEFDYIPNIESGPVHINRPTRFFNSNRFHILEGNPFLERVDEDFYNHNYDSNSDSYHFIFREILTLNSHQRCFKK